MRRTYKEAGGVAWCSVHHGFRNEDESGHCDIFDAEYDELGCELHDMYFTSPVIQFVPVEAAS